MILDAATLASGHYMETLHWGFPLALLAMPTDRLHITFRLSFCSQVQVQNDGNNSIIILDIHIMLMPVSLLFVVHLPHFHSSNYRGTPSSLDEFHRHEQSLATTPTYCRSSRYVFPAPK